MKELWDSVDGYKAYIVMWTMVALVLVEKGFGYDVPGVEVGADWGEWLLGAFGLGAVRNALPAKE